METDVNDFNADDHDADDSDDGISFIKNSNAEDDARARGALVFRCSFFFYTYFYYYGSGSGLCCNGDFEFGGLHFAERCLSR